MTLMEKERPVYPLEIITLMREQRAMLVQTSVQTHTHTQYAQVKDMSFGTTKQSFRS